MKLCSTEWIVTRSPTVPHYLRPLKAHTLKMMTLCISNTDTYATDVVNKMTNKLLSKQSWIQISLLKTKHSKRNSF